MLCEEIKRQEPREAMTYAASRLKRIESYLIQRATRVFLKNGGKVEELDASAAKNPEKFNHSSDEQAEKARENNRKKCLKASMKSKFYPTAFESVFRSDADNTKFVFIIGKRISRQFDRVDQAINGRDYFRRKLES